MSAKSSVTLEAVCLFQKGKIARELQYPEFEAILDGFIPVPEYKSASAKCVYLWIDSNLHVVGAVFFLLPFDGEGIVDRRWNIPLQALLEQAAKGPDLGAGPIRLACHSQCPIDWHKSGLWDPEMAPGNNQFVMLRKAVKANRLGLIFREKSLEKRQEAEDQTPQVNELRNRVARLLKEQRLRIATLQGRHQDRIAALQQEHQQRIELYQEQLAKLQGANRDLEGRNEALKENLETQVNKIQGIHEYFSHKLKAARQDESDQLRELQEQFAIEMEARVQAATAALQEKLDMREVELFYRHEQEGNLRDEVSRLRQENQRLLDHTGDQVLERLIKAGISFVAFHPGVGHITIPQGDMGSYLDNPTAYAAHKCNVSPALYGQWLAHHQNPRCQAPNADGSICGRELEPLDHPRDFHHGESDRCDEHRELPGQKMAAGH